MGKKKKDKIEFRFYELPADEPFLARLGEQWKQIYGADIHHRHFHNLLEIGYCHYGEGELTLGEDSLEFGGGLITVIPANYLHNTKSREKVEAYWEYLFVDTEMFFKRLYPDNPGLAAELVRQVHKKVSLFSKEDVRCTLLVKGILDECREKKAFYMDSAGGMLSSFLIETARRNGLPERVESQDQKGNARIAPALFFISDHYSSPLKVEEMAGVCLMSETNFRRLFVQCMHMTPVEYLNLVRVRMACELLNKTQYAMEEIALKAGFETVSTLNRNFRKLLGTSPYRWKTHPENYENELHHYKISAYRGW